MHIELDNCYEWFTVDGEGFTSPTFVNKNAPRYKEVARQILSSEEQWRIMEQDVSQLDSGFAHCIYDDLCHRYVTIVYHYVLQKVDDKWKRYLLVENVWLEDYSDTAISERLSELKIPITNTEIKP